MRRVLVTGAAGFTGPHVCRRLASSGCEVAAVVSRRSAGGMARAAAETAAAVYACDLTDRDDVQRLCRTVRPDAVVHLAGQNAVDASWQNPDLTLAANLMSTAYLLEGVRPIPGCRVLVVGSTLREPAERLSASPHPYGFSKTLQVETALAWQRWYGLPVIVAEPSNLVGPGGSRGLCGKIARWAATAERAAEAAGVPPFRLSSLIESRDFLDVRDAAAAYELLLREGDPGTAYAVESGTFRCLREVKEAFDRAARVPLRWEVGSSSFPSPAPRDGSAIRRLGWRPAIPFDRSVADALEEERQKIGSADDRKGQDAS